jgi:hypothetical protein
MLESSSSPHDRIGFDPQGSGWPMAGTLAEVEAACCIHEHVPARKPGSQAHACGAQVASKVPLPCHVRLSERSKQRTIPQKGFSPTFAGLFLDENEPAGKAIPVPHSRVGKAMVF